MTGNGDDKRKRRARRGRGEGSIFQRESDGLWVGSVSLGSDGRGKRRRKTVYGETKADVQKELRKLQTKADAGAIPEAGALTLAQYLPRWLEAIKPTVATHTHIPYERDVDKYIVPHLGGVRLTALTSLHVRQLYSDLAAKGVSPSMQRKAGVTLGVALQYAVGELKLIPVNPARGVRKPKVETKRFRAFDAEQARAFLKEARSDRLFALYAVALDSGAREGELFGLAWDDIDFEGGAVRILYTLEETKGALRRKEVKTEKSRRRVQMTHFAMEALAEHRKAMLAEGNCRADGPVFCDTQGGWLRKSNVQRRSLNKILGRAGLPRIRPYDLRHSAATLLLLAGEDAKVVSERLGHSTTRLTQDTYQHVLPGMQQRAADKMEEVLRPKAKGKARQGKAKGA